MDLQVTVVVLIAALLHAVWNAMVKSSADRLVELSALNLAAGLIALPFFLWVGPPGPASLPYILGSMLFHLGYYTFLLGSYARGGLSLVYPIARGASPILVLAASGVVLDEPLSGNQLLAVGFIAISIVSLTFAGGLRALSLRAVANALATGVMIAGYTLTDGAGARLARSPLSYIATLFVLNALPMLLLLPLRRRGVVVERLRAHWKTALLGGALSLAAYGLAIWAMTRGAVALVAALRETSVVIAAIIGAMVLGEPFGRFRIVASVGVTLGILLLRAGG